MAQEDKQQEQSEQKKLLWKNKKVNVPSVLQMEAVECGAASLAMVLAYYGKFVPLEQLRVDCGVSRDGSKASNMLKAARQHGLEAKGFRKEPEGVRDLRLPMIIFWNFNHFVVLTGIKGKRVYINDPASGPRVLTYDEFDQSFTGVVLEFERGPEFKKGGAKPSIVTALRKRLVGTKLALTYAVLAGVCLVIPGLVIPVFSRVFLDNILISGRKDWILPLLWVMGITLAVMAILTWLQQYYLLRLESKLALTSSARFFHHVFRLPTTFFSQRQTGEIANRIQLNDTVAMLLSGDLATNIINLITIIFYAVIMVQYNVTLTGVGAGIALINFLALRYVSKHRTLLNKKLRQEQGKLIGTAMSGLQMIETLKATGSETDFYALWSGYQAKVLNAEQELGVTSRLLNQLPVLLSSLNSVVMLVLGALLVMSGDFTMGMMMAFQSLMTNFISPVNQMVSLGAKVQEAEGDMNKLDDVFKHHVDEQFRPTVPPPEKSSAPQQQESVKEAPIKLEGYLELHHITFGYSRLGPPLLTDFSLSLTPGKRVALVGGSGSGKSTVAKLVTGLYDPWEGDILFDGRPRNAYLRSLVTNSLAMVDQDIFLFGGTVRENLAMWDSTVPDEYILQAARDACIHDDIAIRPGGYESVIEEGGANFSGGQRQRLEIARSLVTNPRLLVLDEATSALDANTEKLVDDNIRRRGCTTLVVAHRLSTIRDADEIIVLEKGQVVQRGTHDEMVKDPESPYAKLIHAH
jgi:NHLM bacteriocin system ABC transporter peptidase/ATP-binding protein